MSQISRGQMLAVAAAALGYFVDLYDIVIFGVVRVVSLRELGVTGQANTDWGIALLNLQMAGMLVGGFFWGWVADRYGRRRALIATIALYSLANLANAFVTNVEQYALLRLLAGIGLAGELGAGITLIAEILPRRARGYGTTVISFLGLVGALAASYAGPLLGWREAYFLGGVMGLAVLVLRWQVLPESTLFEAGRSDAGRLRQLLGDTVLRRRFLMVVLVGVPVWYVSALFVNLAPEYGRALGFPAPLPVAEVLRWQALGLALGSALSGLASEWLASRKRVIGGALALLAALNLGLFASGDADAYVAMMFVIGLAQGYWTAFVTLAAEQFGTGLRGTVATAVPNLVRASTLPITLLLQALWQPLGLVAATLLIGLAVYLLAAASLRRLPETYGRALDFRD